MSLGVPATSPSNAAIEAAYPDWVRAHDTLSEADREAIRADVERMIARPTLSLLLPIGFAAAERLLATLAALRSQLYPHWELYVAGAPQSPEVLAALRTDDRRIMLVDRAPHAHRATAAAAALAHAEGPHVAFLAEGDILPPHALYEIAVELLRFPETELLYTDEDRIDHAGNRAAPRFKTGWDPDLLLSHDYIGALACYRRETIVEAGGPRAGDGAGFGAIYTYDLALRATARMLPDRIRHLPAVLCHRLGEQRALRELALGPDAHATRMAAREFLGVAAEVSPAPLLPSCNRITWALPSPPPVTVIMPTRDHADMLVPAAWGVLLRTDYPALELLIVDNDSQEELTRRALQDLTTQMPNVRVMPYPGRFNFAAINNAAVREARGEVIVLLNNDIDVIHPDWLRELVSHAMRPDVGAVGAKLLYADGRVQHGGVVLAPGPNAAHMLRLAERFDVGYGGQLAVTRSYAAVTAACLAMRRSVFLEIGGLDETSFAVAFNDVDLCLRLAEYGYRVVWTPFAELFHLESASRGVADTEEKAAAERREVELLDRLWRLTFQDDPFSNPNLHTAWNEPLRLCPPRRARPWRHGRA
jgi:O-antigen biosynthesis protein